MHTIRVTISNYRGIKSATIVLPRHGVLIGDNNTGKTTVLEALDLVLGPDRLNRQPPIDEHDFYLGRYLVPKAAAASLVPGSAPAEGGVSTATSTTSATATAADAAADQTPAATDAAAPRIEIEVVIIELNEQQKAAFGDYIEFWHQASNTFYIDPNPEGVDAADIAEALRVTFIGQYEEEEDDFAGKTYFTRSLIEDEDRPSQFTRRHKQICGFLYLRSVRTGSRALSLERGSLLDIILRLKEVRPRMWEDTLSTLADIDVTSAPEVGLAPILQSVNEALKKYVPKEWGADPHLKVSNLTREHLRKVITAFIVTGDSGHAAPFNRQGTGTVNMLVLAMLSQIAQDKQNVIFAMEEPETAIPPYAQKRIVHEIRKLASQTLFTSHSPYVLEEFETKETAVLSRDAHGTLSQHTVVIPANLKFKRYRQDFRTRFCEGLLARRVLVAEGATETSCVPAACRRLEELNPATYSSLEALGVCVVDAAGEDNIAGVAGMYRALGKRVFAVCDLQSEEKKALITPEVDTLYMHGESDTEKMVLNGTTIDALTRFAGLVTWPPHLTAKYSDPNSDARAALRDFFDWSKGNWGLADFLAQCTEAEIPQFLRELAAEIRAACMSVPAVGPAVPVTAPGALADAAD